MLSFRPVCRLSAVLTPFLLLAAAAAHAATYYVSTTGADKNAGTSLTSPFATLQYAITAANEGDTVFVLSGTYKGKGNRNLDFAGTNLTLAAVNSDGTPGSVTLDAQISGRGFLFQSHETAASVIDGFTIIHGNIPDDAGGAVYIVASSPTFTNCTFDSNNAHLAGAVFVYNYANPTFTNCVFSNNTGRIGGATYMDYNTQASFTGCSFTGNSGLYGGAVYTYCSSDSYTDCTFDSNSGYVGGALYTTSNATLTFTNATFSNNAATDRGGASFAGYKAILTFYNGVVFGNSALSGGGFYNSYKSASNLYNTTMTGNSATSKGGAIYNGTYCSPTIFASILWNDKAGAGGNEIFNASTTSVPTVTYSDIQGGWAKSGTNQNVAPLFMGAQDFHLQAASPLIDKGTIYGATISDKGANPRVANSVTDLGASELSTPTITDDSYSVVHNTMLAMNATSGVLANDSANKGGLLLAVLVSRPSIGTLNLNTDGSFAYKPADGYLGTIVFTYQAKNSKGLSAIATVYLTVR